MTAATVEPVLTERTRALVPVHLFGNPAPMEELTELARDARPGGARGRGAGGGGDLRGSHGGRHGDAASSASTREEPRRRR